MASFDKHKFTHWAYLLHNSLKSQKIHLSVMVVCSKAVSGENISVINLFRYIDHPIRRGVNTVMFSHF